MYKVILADPPWEYRDRRLTRTDGSGNKTRFGLGVERRYSKGTQSTDSLAEISPYLQNVCDKDAYLFMWATCPRLPDAFRLMEAWGFSYTTTAFVWVKENKCAKTPFCGPGAYTFSNAELVLMGRRNMKNNCWHSNKAGAYKPKQIIQVPHPRDKEGKIIHSRKPVEVHSELIRWLGPYTTNNSFLELFATSRTPGWKCMGHALSGLDIKEELEQELLNVHPPAIL